MNKLSTWNKINLFLSSIMIFMAVLIPRFQEYSYKGKVKEAKSVVRNIKKAYKNKLDSNPTFLFSINRDEQSKLSQLDVNSIDLKYYNYIVTSSYGSLEIIAEPKIEFLENRTIPPKFYTYKHLNGSKDIVDGWSKL